MPGGGGKPVVAINAADFTNSGFFEANFITKTNPITPIIKTKIIKWMIPLKKFPTAPNPLST